MDEETYRDFLEGITGKRSAAEFNPFEIRKVIKEFKRLGFKVRPQKSLKHDALGLRPGMASPKMLRYIEALWHEVCRADNEKLALRRFLFNRFQVEDLRFLDHEKALKAIEALKQMARRGW